MTKNKRPAKTVPVATKPKARNVKSVPYDKILAEYVADETATISSLAKKFGVSKSTVSRKATKEDWKSKRKVATETTVEAVQTLKAEQIADANRRHVDGSKEVQEAVLNGIRWINSFSDTMTKGKRKKKVADNVPGPVLFSKALSELVGSYRRAADLERAALGLATNVGKFGDEDGNETPIIFDIMGGVANANSNSDKAKPARNSSKS
jgi:hypothetical protein